MFLKNNKSKIVISIFFLVVVLVIPSSCKKFIEINAPKTEIVAETVFTSEASAMATIRGIYSNMISTAPGFTSGGVELFTGLSADELLNYDNGTVQEQFIFNSITTTNSNVLNNFWAPAYKYINNANSVIEGLKSSSGIEQTARKHIEGEALFIRAFCYFYLVNFFGDVPFVNSSDYKVNANIRRSEKSVVYEKIIEDLKAAQSQLAEDFSYSNGERNQPNRGAATALLARVYLYTREWAKAEVQASSLIDSTNRYNLAGNLNDVFLLNSSEAIWQLKPVVPGTGTPQATLFILNMNPGLSFGKVSLSDNIHNAFETGDRRKTDWVGSFDDGTSVFYYPNKYKVDYLNNQSLSEYSMVFRLAEQYLIRAEARIQQDNIIDGIADLNKLRQRARGNNPGDLPVLPDDLDKATALLKVEQERKIELFAEGHRWLDLKRWTSLTDNTKTRADDILGLIKASTWQSADVLYPIPESEILIDPNLEQNPNY